MSENLEHTCCYCLRVKKKIKTNKKLSDGSSVFIDEHGKKWAGKRCPGCERLRVKTSLKYDAFKRHIVAQQLENDGYEIISKSYPLEARKQDKLYLVGIRYAFTSGDKVVFEQVGEELRCDIYAILFQGVRFLSSDKLSRVASNAIFFSKHMKKSISHKSLDGSV